MSRRNKHEAIERGEHHERIDHPEKLKKDILQEHVRVSPYHALPLGDPEEIARLSHLMVRKRLQHVAGRGPASAYWSGLCVYSIEWYGYDFDRLCQNTNQCVAQAIRSISPDMRLPLHRRDDSVLSQLVRSDFFDQCVRMAEIRVRMKILLNRLGKIHKSLYTDVESLINQKRREVEALLAIRGSGAATGALDDMRRIAQLIETATRHYRQRHSQAKE